MSRPTHRVIATGELVFPEGYADDAIEPASEAVLLAVDREERWAAVKARRDIAEWAGCATPLGRVDTDPASQRKVGGAVQLALIAQGAGSPFALDWTMQDNSSVTHDAAAMIQLGVAVGMHVAACHEVALAKRASIDTATTAEDVAAVDLETGWPS